MLKKSHPGVWDEMIDMPQVMQWVENFSRARHELFILDACFSGLVAVQSKGLDANPVTLQRLSKRSSYILTAGLDKQESYAIGGSSLFTEAFLLTVRGKLEPPVNGIVGVNDMMSRINSYIDAKKRQLNGINMTPQVYKGRVLDNEGEFFFLLPQGSQRPVEQASVLRNPEAKNAALSSAAPPTRFDPRTADLRLWESAQSLGTKEAYQDYLTHYPRGQYAEQAKLHIAALSRPASPVDDRAPAAAERSGQRLAEALSPHTSSSARSGSAPPLGVLSQMVYIPAGSFHMGDQQTGPQHLVHVSAFWIGKYDVTFDQWDACVAAEVCMTLPDDEGWGRGRRPVINVNWDDLHNYVNWLSRKTGQHYRLPTEAEWEYAAGAGTTTTYYWGREFERGHANCAGCGSRWDNKQTAPVGSFAPNPWGLYDMAGNVWQAMEDCNHPDYQGAPADGSAWMDRGGCLLHVVRGGPWNDFTVNLRSASRGWWGRGAAKNVGFRVARDP